MNVQQQEADGRRGEEADQALRLTNAKLQGLIQASPLAIYALDREGKIRSWNAAAERMFGWSEAEALGRPVPAVPPEKEQEARQLHERVLRGETFTSIEARRQRKDGTLIDVSFSAAPLFEADGQVSGMMAVVADITEQKRAREARLGSEENYRLLFEHNLAGVYRTTLDGQVIDCNPACARILGYSSREELMAYPFEHYYYQPADRKLNLERLLAHGSLRNFELCLRRRDGSPVWILENVRLVEVPDGEPIIEGTMIDITDRWRADTELARERDLLHTLLENIPDLIYFKDTASRYTRINPTEAKYLGVNQPGEAIDKTDFDFYPPELAREFYADEQIIFRTGRPVINKVERQTGVDSTERYLLTTKVPMRDQDGRITGLVGVSKDITEQRRAVEALRRSQQNYEALVNSIEGIVWEYDLRTNAYTFVSQQAERLLGYPLQRWQTETDFWKEHVHINDRDWVIELCQEAALQKRNHAVEYRMVAADERVVWLRDSVTVVVENDQPIKLRGVMVDITERKQATEALARERAILRGLIDSIPDLIFYKDRDSVYLGCNAAFEKYAGRSEQELVGLSDHDLFPAEIGRFYRAKDRHVLAEGKPSRDEEWITYPDGRQILVEVLKTPFFGPDGEILGLIGVSRDITERQRLEEQLRQAQKMEAIGQLAGGVAHDFNNLLTVILGNASLLLASSLPGDANRELLAPIERAAGRAAELTSQLLGFSRRTALRLEPTDLNDCIREAVRILQRTIDPRVTIEVRGGNDLWTVLADPGQVSQVLMNLCLNARDAMPNGGRLLLETANVVLEAEVMQERWEARPGEFACLKVADTGHGIPPEIRPRIFDPFFTTKGPGRGTGLGLSMVYGIIQQHQGWIECTSEVGRGATFNIYLPRHGAKPKPVAATPEALPAANGFETILLADDEEMIRKFGRSVLEQQGYHVLVAVDGQEAVDIFLREKDRISLVILDLTMPRLSGRDALRQLQQIDPGAPVLLASGYSAEHLTDAEKEAVLGFINKPYRPEDLATMVRGILDRVAAGAIPAS